MTEKLGRCSLGRNCKHDGWVYEGEVMRSVHSQVIHEDCFQASRRLVSAFGKVIREVVLPTLERQRGGLLALARALQRAEKRPES